MGNPNVPMNVWLEFLFLASHSHCLDNCLFQLVRWCSVSHGNWMKQKKRDIRYIWLQSDDMTHIAYHQWIRESSALPSYYHISTSTYQFRCSLFSHFSSAEKINDFFLNKAGLTSLLIIATLSSLCSEQWDQWLSNIFSHSSTVIRIPHIDISYVGN